jgi:hypothetical protein
MRYPESSMTQDVRKGVTSHEAGEFRHFVLSRRKAALSGLLSSFLISAACAVQRQLPITEPPVVHTSGVTPGMAGSQDYVNDFSRTLKTVLEASGSDFVRIRGDLDVRAPERNTWMSRIDLPGSLQCRIFLTRTTKRPTYWCEMAEAPSEHGPLQIDFESAVQAIKRSTGWPEQPFKTPEDVAGKMVVFRGRSSAPIVSVAILRRVNAVWQVNVSVSSGHTIEGYNESQPISRNSEAQQAPPPSIKQEVDEVENSGIYVEIPAIQPQRARLSLPSGMTVYSAENGTPYSLRLLFSGPTETDIVLASQEQRSITLEAGLYRVVGRVSSPSVLPYFAKQTYGPGLEYPYHFYIQ